MFVFGGITSGCSVEDNLLYILNLESNVWTSEKNQNKPVPVARYGHSFMLFKDKISVLFGGIDKYYNALNDTWTFDVSNHQWTYIKLSKIPQPRAFFANILSSHTETKDDYIIFGGLSEYQIFNDVWCLRKSITNHLEWEELNGIINSNSEKFTPRFGHAALVEGDVIYLIGGLSEDGCNDIEILDLTSSMLYSVKLLPFLGHAGFIDSEFIYCFGGFAEEIKLVQNRNLNTEEAYFYFKEEKKVNATFYNLLLSLGPTHKIKRLSLSNLKIKQKFNRNKVLSTVEAQPKQNEAYFTLNDNLQSTQKIVELHSNSLSQTTFIYNIELRVDNEVLILNCNEQNRSIEENLLYNKFISKLLNYSYFTELNKSSTYKIPKFPFRNEHIIALASATKDLLLSQPMVLKVTTPVKIYGDLHGQYEDLLRFFKMFKEPSQGYNGDINCCDYLFLGDYVDRGSFSLEIICLLMSLKLKYPDKIWLIRGNHEDSQININFGFYQECVSRLKNDAYSSKVFEAINDMFDCLPIAAIVDNQILCLHGGIGQSLENTLVLENLIRPLSIVHEASTKLEQIVMDVLWSDPTESDQVKGIQPNQVRDGSKYGNIVKFGPDIVEKFLDKNNFALMIRAHECVMDGFERFSGGKLITVFSATDYCKKHKNAGAMLLINTKLEIIPYIIYPTNSENVCWIESEEDYLKRPPTPIKERVIKK